MKLQELEPHTLHTPEGRGGLGVSFACPHCVRLVQAHRADGSSVITCVFSPREDDPPIARIGVVFDVATDREPHPHGFDHPHLRPAHPDDHRWSHNHCAPIALTLDPAIDCSADDHWHGSILDGETIDAAPT